MIKVLWLLNNPLSVIAEHAGIDGNNSKGWTELLAVNLSLLNDIDLTVVFPHRIKNRIVSGKTGQISYIGYYEPSIPETEYNQKTEGLFRTILNEHRPDIVHIWGTEFVHSLCMVNAFDRPERTVISIQGLISCIGRVYCEGIPEDIQKRYTFRDRIRKDSIYDQKQKFLKRGKFEIDAIKKARNVAGRTKWDKETILSINPNVHYYFCREVLREEFYKAGRWEYSKCEKHSIFVSQSYYPIKGMHYALDILRRVKEKYPDARLYTTGSDVSPGTIKGRLKQNSYARYLEKIINAHNLTDSVCFCGRLNASQMIERYLLSNVFLQTSVIENSPNSLGEAMILGVPCIASRVGGTESIFHDGQDGFLFNYDDVDTASRLIMETFEKRDRIIYTDNAVKHALSQFEREAATDDYYDMYMKMVENPEEVKK